MKYVHTIFDGRNQAGLGSIIQAQLILNAYANKKQKLIFFPGFINLYHWQFENLSKEKYCENLNFFVSKKTSQKKSTTSVFISDIFLVKYWAEFKLEEIIDYNRNKYQEYLPKNKEDKLIVAIHYRTHLKTEIGLVDKNSDRFSSLNFYENAIQYCLERHKEILQFNLYCLNKDQTTLYLSKKYNVIIKDDTSLRTTFSDLRSANILIASKSSLSWSAHLYGLNQYVISQPFWHPWSKSTILLNERGKKIRHNLNLKTLKRKIKSFKYYFFKTKRTDIF